MLIVLIVVHVVVLSMTLLPLWSTPIWWIRAMEFPRLQLSVMALGLLLAEIFLLDRAQPTSWLAWASIAACLAWQAWWILPYTRLRKKEVESSRDADPDLCIRLICANVLGTNRRADDFLALVRKHDPDVVVTLESNAWWQSRLDTLEPDYPHTIKCPLENLYGMHVYSKLPLHDTRIKYLTSVEIPSMHACATLRSGDEIRLRFLHPQPPSPEYATDTSKRDAELVVVAKNAEGDMPTIIAGDLNDVAWSQTTRLFRKISGLLDPRIGRGFFNTFHAQHWFLRWPLDHLFHTAHFSVKSLSRLPEFGSDHFALLSELVFEPDLVGKESSNTSASNQDEERARETVGEESVDESDVPDPGR